MAVNSTIINDETSALILSKVKSQALGLAGQLDSIALDDEIVAMLNENTSISTESGNSSDSSSDEGDSDAQSEEEEEEEEDAGFGGLGDLFG